MAHTPHAKYSLAGHPVMRQMLGPERAKAIELGLALIDGRLAVTRPGPELELLREKRRQAEAMLRGARKVHC